METKQLSLRFTGSGLAYTRLLSKKYTKLVHGPSIGAVLTEEQKSTAWSSQLLSQSGFKGPTYTYA